MKENIFEVIMYLFENYMDDNSELHTDQESLSVELKQAGFLSSEISKAFDWLEGLVSLKEKTLPHAMPNKLSIRVYNQSEQKKLNLECRGYLLRLEQIHVLNEITRELVIDRSMALETDDFTLDHLKWVVLLVLFNQPDQEEAFLWMEDIILDPGHTVLH